MSNFVATVETSLGQFAINCFNTTREDVLDELDGHDLEALVIEEMAATMLSWGVVYECSDGQGTFYVEAYTEEGARSEFIDQTAGWGIRPQGIIRVECWGAAK